MSSQSRSVAWSSYVLCLCLPAAQLALAVNLPSNIYTGLAGAVEELNEGKYGMSSVWKDNQAWSTATSTTTLPNGSPTVVPVAQPVITPPPGQIGAHGVEADDQGSCPTPPTQFLPNPPPPGYVPGPGCAGYNGQWNNGQNYGSYYSNGQWYQSTGWNNYYTASYLSNGQWYSSPINSYTSNGQWYANPPGSWWNSQFNQWQTTPPYYGNGNGYNNNGYNGYNGYVTASYYSNGQWYSSPTNSYTSNGQWYNNPAGSFYSSGVWYPTQAGSYYSNGQWYGAPTGSYYSNGQWYNNPTGSYYSNGQWYATTATNIFGQPTNAAVARPSRDGKKMIAAAGGIAAAMLL